MEPIQESLTEAQDENHPALVRAVVALYDLLEAIDDLRVDHGSACLCEACTELHGIRYTIELFLGCLESQTTRSPTIAQCEWRRSLSRVS